MYDQSPGASARIANQGSAGPVVQMYGILCVWAFVAMAALIGGGWSPYARKCTLSVRIRLSAMLPAFASSLSVLRTTSSRVRFLPYSSTYTPPSALISATAACIPQTPPTPNPPYMPVCGAGTPTRIFAGTSPFSPRGQLSTAATTAIMTTITMIGITTDFRISFHLLA